MKRWSGWKSKAWSGQGWSALALADDGISYLLRDLFTTADAAPITSPRTCEPGPGTWTAVETDGATLAISGGKLLMTGSNSSYNHCSISAESDIAAGVGRGICFKLQKATAGVAGYMEMDSANSDGRIWWHGVNLKLGQNTLVGLAPAGFDSTAAHYGYVAIFRGTGGVWIIDGKLLHKEDTVWSNSIQPRVRVYTGAASAFSLGFVESLDLPANGYAEWDADYSTVTDSETNPSTGTAIDCAADCWVTGTVTVEDTKYVYVYIRYTDANNWVRMSIGTDRVVKLQKNVATSVTDVATGSTLTDATNYRYDIVANGTTVTVYINRALDATGTISDHATVAQGRAEHTLATNDLVVITHPYPNLGIADVWSPCPQAAGTFTHSADFVSYFYVDTLPSSGTIDVQYRISGSDEWTVQINSSGDLLLLENATARITDSAVLSGGERICLVMDDDDAALYYDATQSGTYASATLNKTATSGKISSLGTGGVISRLECLPRDVSALLPNDWS